MGDITMVTLQIWKNAYQNIIKEKFVPQNRAALGSFTTSKLTKPNRKRQKGSIFLSQLMVINGLKNKKSRNLTQLYFSFSIA